MRLVSALFACCLCTQVFASANGLTFTNKEEGGKKVWIPSSTDLKAGEDVTFTLVNTLKDVHGFEIPGLTEQVPVPGGESKTIVVKAPKAGSYPYRCHMHPAHVGGTLTVK